MAKDYIFRFKNDQERSDFLKWQLESGLTGSVAAAPAQNFPDLIVPKLSPKELEALRAGPHKFEVFENIEFKPSVPLRT